MKGQYSVEEEQNEEELIEVKRIEEEIKFRV
jgi:hypothetical protein